MSMGMEKIPLFAVAPHHLADLQEQNAAEELAVVAPEGVAVAEGITVERVGRPRFGHRPGCACCAPRAALAEALNRLFIRRARAEVAFFRRVAIALPRAELAAPSQTCWFRRGFVSKRRRCKAWSTVVTPDRTREFASGVDPSCPPGIIHRQWAWAGIGMERWRR